MTKLLLLAFAGVAGTLARYGLSGLVQKWWELDFPIGTAVVNVAGCLAFGLLWAWSEDHLAIGPELRIAIFVGFFGAFTTFSSFAYETVALLQDAQWAMAALNIIGQNLLGLAAMILGLAAGRLLG